LAGCCPYFSKVDQAKSLADMLIKTAKQFALTGEIFANSKLQQDRVSVCNKCENKDGSKCKVCGCTLSSKIVPIGSTCPLGRW
jgi:hypothetical protein